MVITKAEYEKAKNAVNNAYTKESVDAYSKAYNGAMKSGSTSKEALKSASWLLKKNETTGGGSSNINSTDVYGDVSGVRSSGVWPKDYSNYQETTLSPDLNKYGASAREMEKAKAGSISQRNDILAWNLYKQGITDKEGIRKYLNDQPWFQDTEDWEQDNTVDAIWTRMWGKDKEGETTGGTITGETTTGGDEWEFRSKAGYYYDKGTGEYMKIYWYDWLSDKQKNQLDNLSEEKKKEISNRWAEALQEYLRIDTQAKRDLEQAEARQDINQDLYDINRESSLIQAEQTLRNAEESYNNLKQNWQYLGNMWMPGTSSTKIQAIWDAISEAKTTLGEVKRLTQLSLDAQEKQWEGQVLQYNQQIDNLMYDLKWKIWQEAVDALSKYTAAELEWKLDTIDGITAFRKEILDELDSNLSWITSASLTQMQMINQEYQDIANKMYDYVQNANKVNTEMSSVKGYYVDGNGNPILNNQGQPIQVPQNAPMEPVFDKETGRLITFGLDENGNIVASVQQVYQGNGTATQSAIVSMLEQGVSVQDILKYVPWVDLKTVQDLAEIVQPLVKSDYSQYNWRWPKYNAVDEETTRAALLEMPTSGVGGWCWAYVNQYLQKMWFPPSFIQDSLQSKLDIRNSDTPKVGDVVVFDYNHITPETWENNGHVGIVKDIKDWKIIVQDSNFDGDRKIKIREVDMNSKSIMGYFDPTKSIDAYNEDAAKYVYEEKGLNEYGYKDIDTTNYDHWLKDGDKYFSNADKERIAKEYGSFENFKESAKKYQKKLDSEVSDASQEFLKTLYKLEWMTAWQFTQAKKAPQWMTSWWLSSGGNRRSEIWYITANDTLNNLINKKQQGATFGSLSEWELWILQNAASKIAGDPEKWNGWENQTYEFFHQEIKNQINAIEGEMKKRGYDYTALKNEVSSGSSGEPDGGHLEN